MICKVNVQSFVTHNQNYKFATSNHSRGKKNFVYIIWCLCVGQKKTFVLPDKNLCPHFCIQHTSWMVILLTIHNLFYTLRWRSKVLWLSGEYLRKMKLLLLWHPIQLQCTLYQNLIVNSEMVKMSVSTKNFQVWNISLKMLLICIVYWTTLLMK